ncbi:MAG: hypothetical protein WDO24_14565 [Pseudomonadota bacterium]
MAASVTTPLERQFSLIAGVTETDLDELARHQLDHRAVRPSIAASTPRRGDIQSAINAAGGQLPSNLPSPPSYRKSTRRTRRSCCWR